MQNTLRFPGPEDFKTSSGIALCEGLINDIHKETLLKHWHPELISTMGKIGIKADKDDSNLFYIDNIEPEDLEQYNDFAETHDMPSIDIETFHRLYSSALSYKDLRGALEFERHLHLTGQSPFHTDGLTEDAKDFFYTNQNDMAFMLFDWLIMTNYPELPKPAVKSVFSRFINQIENELLQKTDDKQIYLEDLPQIVENMRKTMFLEKAPLQTIIPSNELPN